MHWCEYPSPTNNLIQAKKQLNKSANTEKQYQKTQARSSVKTVGVTGNYQNGYQKTSSKKVYIVLSPKHKSFTDTEAQMDKNGS